MNDNTPILYLVIPCYNEEEILPLSIDSINYKINSLIHSNIIDSSSKIVFVNDGSNDNTLSVLKGLKTSNMVIISLSSNCGHQNALIAGLEYAFNKCDCVISLDCDLQDDINLIDSMVDKFLCGYDVVYGVRNDRTEDSFFKRYSANSFYTFMSFLGVNIVKNHADYRLLSNRVVQALLCYGESNLFLRGIIPLLGFNSCNLYYKRQSRVLGKSKYPFLKMLGFALDGITSFSIKPLRLLSIVGAIVSIVSLLFGIWALCVYIMGGSIRGWTSIIIPMFFLGGLQMLGLGILGEYIGKIYKETKHRPRYFIGDIIS